MIQWHFDWLGEPMTAIEWALRLEEGDVHVEETWIGDLRVSTVWTGLATNHLHNPEELPLIFETMIFQRGGRIHDFNQDYMTRYPDAGSAKAGHENIVAAIRDRLKVEA